MNLPEIVSREEWLEARRALLAQEKELTRLSDAVNAARRDLPILRVEKDYRFRDANGVRSLHDLFQGRTQLVVYHFMFGPEWETGCPGCTAVVDEVANGLLTHLNTRDTTLAFVSRAPIEKLDAYKSERGWSIDWYSSGESDFNYDFHVTLDPNVAPLLFNYRDSDELAASGRDWVLDDRRHPLEISGASCFVRRDGEVFHTYSTYERGTEAFIAAYRVLDLSVLGRQEDWEIPAGRADMARPADPSFGGGLH